MTTTETTTKKMANYRYVFRNGGKNCKYLPNDLVLSILWLGDCYALSGMTYGITEKTWKTLKGVQNYVAREYPMYEFDGEF